MTEQNAPVPTENPDPAVPAALPTVRAKFKVSRNENGIIALDVVHSGSPENDRFFHLTPSGHIDIGTVNEVAAKRLVVGKEYYVDFTAAPEPQP
jgi:hypothetical protein